MLKMRYCFVYLELVPGEGHKAVRTAWVDYNSRNHLFELLKDRVRSGEASNLKLFAKRSKHGQEKTE